MGVPRRKETLGSDESHFTSAMKCDGARAISSSNGAEKVRLSFPFIVKAQCIDA